MGRPGRVAGTRELVVSGLPYILPYIEKADSMIIDAYFNEVAEKVLIELSCIFLPDFSRVWWDFRNVRAERVMQISSSVRINTYAKIS